MTFLPTKDKTENKTIFVPESFPLIFCFKITAGKFNLKVTQGEKKVI